jgi:3'-5' exoribonuclease
LPDFPTDLAIILKHLILSHHGKFEFGSPKRPKTLEAMMLHYLDDIDSKICAVTDYIEKESTPDSKWTAYNRLMDRFIYTDIYNKNKSSED